MKKLLVTIMVAALAAGCSTTESRIRENPEAFARLNPTQQALVQAGQVAIGFSMDAVKLALGDPDRITTRTDGSGQTQIWHYITWEDDGIVLYTGYYHHYHHSWWRGVVYPWYMDYPHRTVHDHFRVEFRNGLVTSIIQEVAGSY